MYGLQPWRMLQGAAKIKSYALAWWDDAGVLQQAVKLWPERADITEVLKRIAASGRTCLTWNGAFDIAWLCADGAYPEVWKIKWLDAMLLWRHLEVEPEYDTNRNHKRSYSLESAIDRFYPGQNGFKEFEDFDATDAESMRKLAVRNLGDAKFTLQIGYDLAHLLPPKRLRPAIIESWCMPMVGRANCFGMDVDVPYTQALSARLGGDAQVLLDALSPHGVTETVVRSPKQLGEVLYGRWGLPPQGQTDSGLPSTDKEALYNLAEFDHRAKMVKEYREALNNRSKFADAILEAVRYNGEPRVHPGIRIFSTYTGRMTVSSKVGRNSAEKTVSSALHQTKRGELYRSPLVAPEGYTIVEFDARSQEYRWMGILSGDETMLGLCQDGEDAHAYMGAAVIGVDYATMLKVLHDEHHVSYNEYRNGRQLGKVVNLSAQYRTSARKIRVISQVNYDTPMTQSMSVQVHGMYRRVYRRVPEYWNNAILRGRALGYVETLAGRQVQLRDPWDREHTWMLESTCINYPIQGVGADQKYLAMMCIRDVVSKHQAFFWFEMHDGLYFLVPNERVPAFCRDGKRVLDNLPYQRAWDFTPPVPMPWDCKTGESWGKLKEWNDGC